MFNISQTSEEQSEVKWFFSIFEGLSAQRRCVFVPSNDLILKMITAIIKHGNQPDEDVMALFGL